MSVCISRPQLGTHSQMIAEDARMKMGIIVSKGYFLYAYIAPALKQYNIYTAVSVPSPNKCWGILVQD
jgi:hypothetical protein